MREIWRRLVNWRQAHGLWALAIVAAMSLLAAGAEFVILVQRESQLVDRFSDSTWWMAAQFRSEIQQLHISLASYDGSEGGLDDIHQHYEILGSRIQLMDESRLDPRPDEVLGNSIAEVRHGAEQLAQQIETIKIGGGVPRHLLDEDIRALERAAGRMTSLGAQSDATHREAVRSAIRRANVAFGVALAMLIGSLLLSLRAVDRQAATLDAARRRSEALGQELTVALAQAQAGSRAKNVFLATMSHEIRTPMNGVLGATSLLAHTQLNDQQRRWVAIIKACGEALLSQLDDVLDFSALEAASVRLERELFDIRTLAEDAGRVVESAAGANGLDLVVVIDHDVPAQVLTDRRRLGQILLNLLTNAVKFTASGGVSLRVSMRRRHGKAWLRAAVVDSGPGIPRADRRRIFQEFTRLERPSERTVRGTGLGLAISQRIAQALGGRIRVAAARGGGSVFWVSIPVEMPQHERGVALAHLAGRVAVVGGTPGIRAAVELLVRAAGYEAGTAGDGGSVDLLLLHRSADAPPGLRAARQLPFGPGTGLDAPITAERLQAALAGGARPSRASVPLAQAGRSLRLLVADDDAINREIAASLLRHLGHDVEIVSDGREALAAVRLETFDAVLLDLYMPGMDGIDLAKAIRALPGEVAAMRLIAVTADADANVGASVLAAGIDSVLIKPVTLERLAEVLLPLTGTAKPAAASAAPPSPGLVVDRKVRDMLITRLPAGRLPALVRTFWDGVQRVLDVPGGLSGEGLERWLHTISGSAGSLGYAAATTAAKLAREAVDQGVGDAPTLSALYTSLAAAVRADEALLPPPFVAMLTVRLTEAAHAMAQMQAAHRQGEPMDGRS